jgi:hypothetical protein
MATQSEAPHSHATQEALEQIEAHSWFRTAIQRHQNNLRMDINLVETFVGHIAESTDPTVTQHLSEAYIAISNLRTCLAKLQTAWIAYDNRQESFDDT